MTVLLVGCFLTASVLSEEEKIQQFENKVSELIQKLMDSKYIMSDQESSILKERLAKFDKNFGNQENVPDHHDHDQHHHNQDHLHETTETTTIRESTTSVLPKVKTTTTKPTLKPVNHAVLLTKVNNKLNESETESE